MPGWVERPRDVARFATAVFARDVQRGTYPRSMLDERIVRFRPRAILTVIGVVLAVAILIEVLWVTRSVIIWVLIALFLAMALNPAVEFLVRRGTRRGPAVGIVFVGAILLIVG